MSTSTARFAVLFNSTNFPTDDLKKIRYTFPALLPENGMSST